MDYQVNLFDNWWIIVLTPVLFDSCRISLQLLDEWNSRLFNHCGDNLSQGEFPQSTFNYPVKWWFYSWDTTEINALAHQVGRVFLWLQDCWIESSRSLPISNTSSITDAFLWLLQIRRPHNPLRWQPASHTVSRKWIRGLHAAPLVIARCKSLSHVSSPHRASQHG